MSSIKMLKSLFAYFFNASIGRLTATPARIRVFTFHDISNDEHDLGSISPKRFGEFLGLLEDEGYTSIDCDLLISGRQDMLSLDHAVLLTFDDGLVSHREIAAEMLHQSGHTAIFFPITAFVCDRRERTYFGGRERTFMNKKDLYELGKLGLEVGSHSHTHPLCGQLSEKEFVYQAEVSKRTLENVLGREVMSFAYPFGRAGAYSAITESVLESSGYKLAFTQEGTRMRLSTSLLTLPRVSVDRSDTIKTLKQKLLGQHDLLHEVRKYMRNSFPF